MHRLTLLAETQAETLELAQALREHGFACEHASSTAEMQTQQPELVIALGMDAAQLSALTETLDEYLEVPVMALLEAETLPGLKPDTRLADFMAWPGSTVELVLRIRRLFAGADSSPDARHYGALSINPVSCRVLVAGRTVSLTFREFELLKYLAGNADRVLTREALLDNVWGYDYIGGDRTVDVHVRRLRSKIEISGHTFIDTVRNIGYRFRA